MVVDSNRAHGLSPQRFFDPSRPIWIVDREMVLLAAGGRALLMQIAHPKVAAGVAAHSDFETDPLGRLHRTMSSMWAIVFDETLHARAVLQRIEAIHKRVQGAVPAGEAPAGEGYTALDQNLLLWVHATLIDSALAAYELLVTPLTEPERRGYYADSKKLGLLLGIEERNLPDTLEAFQTYLAAKLESGQIFPGPTARRLAASILHPRPWLLRPGGPLFRLLTAGLLPEPLRRGYGFHWNEGRQKRYRLAVKVIRSLRPALPSFVRIVPNARRAERTIRRGRA